MSSADEGRARVREMVRREFGRRLMRLCAERGLTLREVARRMGCMEQQLSAYANGRRMPTLLTVVRLQRAFGCTWAELLGPEGRIGGGR